MSDGPCTTELEIKRLRELDALAVNKLPVFADDGLCAYCGFRPKAVQHLCAACVERRQQLRARYPEVGVDPLREPRTKPATASGFARLSETDMREWLPHNSE